jgi:hypothetical protein
MEWCIQIAIDSQDFRGICLVYNESLVYTQSSDVVLPASPHRASGNVARGLLPKNVRIGTLLRTRGRGVRRRAGGKQKRTDLLQNEMIFLKKNPDPRPFGVPLDDLQKAINQTNLKASRDGNSLIVRNENVITRIDVVPPAKRECGDANIKAVVQIKTEVPKEVAGAFFTDPRFVTRFNAMATLGALTVEKDGCFMGSRLTIYEQENGWNLHFGILLCTIIVAADSFYEQARPHPI